MFCSKCGKVIREDAMFCPYCGTRVDETSEISAITESETAGEQTAQSVSWHETEEQSRVSQNGETGRKRSPGGLLVFLAIVAAVLLLCFWSRDRIPFLRGKSSFDNSETGASEERKKLSKDDEALNPPYPSATPVSSKEYAFFDDYRTETTYKQDDSGNLYKQREYIYRYGKGDYKEIVNTEKEYNPDGSLASEKNSRSERSVDKTNHTVTNKYYNYDGTLSSTQVRHYESDDETLVLDERFRPDGSMDYKVEYVTEEDYTRTSYNADNTINCIEVYEKGEKIRKTDYKGGAIDHETLYEITYRGNYLIQKDEYSVRNGDKTFVKSTAYEYDFEGNLVTESETDNQYVTRYTKRYDAKGNETDSFVFDKDYTQHYRSIYIYDDNENVIARYKAQSIYYYQLGNSSENESVTGVTTYVYSKSGTLIREMEYKGSDQNCTHAVIYLYDTEGRITKETEYGAVPEYDLEKPVPDARELMMMDASPFITWATGYQFDETEFEDAPIQLTKEQAQELATIAMGLQQQLLFDDSNRINEYNCQADIRNMLEREPTALSYFLWCVFLAGHQRGEYDWETAYSESTPWYGGYYIDTDEAKQLLKDLFGMNADFNRLPSEPNGDLGTIYKNGELSVYVGGIGWLTSYEYAGVEQSSDRFEVVIRVDAPLETGDMGEVGRIYLRLSPSKNSRGYEIIGYRFTDGKENDSLKVENTAHLGWWNAGDRAQLYVKDESEDSILFDLTFIRLTGTEDVKAAIAENGRGDFSDGLQISGSIFLEPDKITITLNDVPNFYFEYSLIEFVGSETFVFYR